MVKFVAAVVITIVSMSIFSIPLISFIAPLGNILLPGSGVWNVQSEVPISETIFSADLTEKVTVYRDEWGVPHVFAKTEEDVGFAIGYLHAQDRFFQMDLIRRLVRGKLSEVLGELALSQDKYNLATGKEYWAQKTTDYIMELVSQGEIEHYDTLESYSKGINYYLDTHQSNLPLEYQILDFKPTHWSMLDTMCLTKYMAEMLTWQTADLYRLINIEALGTEDFKELFVSTYGQIPICPNYGEYIDSSDAGEDLKQSVGAEDLKGEIMNFIKNIEEVPSYKQIQDLRNENLIGSNNWVINGIKSDTGKPILCNDMHLAWTMPGIWYEAHLVAEDTGLNTYGFTLPGGALPIVGHNQYLGWGFTNTGYDVMDWYYFTEVDEDHYIYNGEAKEYETRTYEINVTGNTPVEFTVKETVHGPVLNDFIREDRVPTSIRETNYVLCPKWTAYRVTRIWDAITGFNYAKNREEFNEASKDFDVPAQNIVYGDIYGNIGIRPTGLVPIREGNGYLPYNGSKGEGEWTGYVPFEDLPHSENPDQNYLVSANQIAVGPDYTQYLLQNSYATGYRARRINELLSSAPDGSIGIDEMKAFQCDIISSAAKAFTPFIINAIEAMTASERTTLINNVLTELKDWNYKMDKELSTPSIYRKWRDYFQDYTFEEMSAKGAIGSPQLNVLEGLTRDSPNSKWFDDTSTTDVIETRDDIILKALEAALNDLIEFYNTEEISMWKWGKIHQDYFVQIAPGLDSLSIGPFEADGEGYTVNPSGANIRNGVGYARGGASERVIMDFSNLNNTISVIPSGERGYSNSRHYSDQLEELFLQGKYHVQYFSNTLSNFPQNSITSSTYFNPLGGG